MAEEAESPLLTSRSVFVEEFWAVCSPSYLQGAAPPSTAKELEQQRYVVYDDSRPMHDTWWRSVMGRSAAPPRVLCSIANLDEMLHLTEQGFGVAVLPNYLVSELVARGKLLRILPRKLPTRNPIQLVWRRSSIETSRFKVVRDALF
jgi:DNA-binding transcriptional LysR family regulator